MQVFLDCDGVLADFDKRAAEILGMNSREYEKEKGAKDFWKRIYSTPDFFFSLDKMPDADELVNAVKHLNPIILTGRPQGNWAEAQKLAWRDKNFPDLEMIVCLSKEKFLHMHHDKDNFLVDDWTQHQHIWEDASGTFIHHTSAADSIRQLRELGVL